MNISSFTFQAIDWSNVLKEKHKGDTGTAYWQVQHLNNIRVRKVEYSPGYKADHWCSKGHVLFCYKGEMTTELKDGRIFTLYEGMCYFVGDNNEPHRSFTEEGCLIFIVD